MSHDFGNDSNALERKALARRHLLRGIGAGAGVVFLGRSLPQVEAARDVGAKPPVFPLTHVNHLVLAVPDYARSRDFYVDLFGMRVVWDDGKNQCGLEFGSPTRPNGVYIRNVPNRGDKPFVHHIAYAMEDFMTHKASMKAELERRGVKNLRPDGAVGWTFDDPTGLSCQIVVVKHKAMFPGAAAPCEDAESAKCREAYEAGLKGLAQAPKPSGRGFVASAFSRVTVHVPDIAVEAAFLRDMFGMKVIRERAGQNPATVLRFGENTLYVEKTVDSQGRPSFGNHFGFVIDQWNQAKVKSELERRGFAATASSQRSWEFVDPDGFPVEVADKGSPEVASIETRPVSVRA